MSQASRILWTIRSTMAESNISQGNLTSLTNPKRRESPPAMASTTTLSLLRTTITAKPKDLPSIILREKSPKIKTLNKTPANQPWKTTTSELFNLSLSKLRSPKTSKMMTFKPIRRLLSMEKNGILKKTKSFSSLPHSADVTGRRFPRSSRRDTLLTSSR